MAKTTEPGATPKLRFPEYRESDTWSEAKVGELVTTVTPPAKLQTSSYMASGAFPIVDQSQDQFCGWTNDARAVITKPLPLVVFGDHTCALKFVREPFAQGADGIKILRANNTVDAEFLFHSLSHHPLEAEDYKRHFSTLTERRVLFPDITSGEQQKIADCLTSLDEVIAAQARKVEALKAHKRALMQQLFPREGETVPRLRFPEFRNAPEWREHLLGALSDVVRGGSPRPIDAFITDQEDGLNWLKIGDVDREAKYVTSTVDKVRPEALSKTRVICPGDFILSNSMSFGRPYISTITTCIHDGWIAVTNIPSDLSREFLFYLMLANRSQRYFTNQAAGSGVKNLNVDIVSALPVVLPDHREQEIIAESFAAADEAIASSRHALERFVLHKAGLMQQLFPSPESAS